MLSVGVIYLMQILIVNMFLINLLEFKFSLD